MQCAAVTAQRGLIITAPNIYLHAMGGSDGPAGIANNSSKHLFTYTQWAAVTVQRGLLITAPNMYLHAMGGSDGPAGIANNSSKHVPTRNGRQ